VFRRGVAACVVALAATAFVAPAGASPIPLSGTVSEDPAGFTPRITVGNAPFAAVKWHRQMFFGGEFTEVQNADRSQTYTRENLFSFKMSDGSVTPFSIDIDGDILALATDRTSLYVGGNFTRVNNIPRRGLVKLDPVTGRVDKTFKGRLGGVVQDMEVASGRLIVGGKFHQRLTALDLATGDDLGYLDLDITGTTGDRAGATDIRRFAISPDKTKLVAVGNFTAVEGETRWRAFMVDLGPTVASLASWYYTNLDRGCNLAPTRPAQLRDVDFSPDGSMFFIVATGGGARPGDRGLTICDGAGGFDTDVDHPSRPAWVTYANGDTLLSVVATEDAVYVQGHEKTLGSSKREGIGALNPNNGAVLSWDPWKQRGFGGQVLVVTGAKSGRPGLWVGSDTKQIGGGTSPGGGPAGSPTVHERLAFLPAN
jgi:Domain of unknown function (DUF5122) beta-propeller